MTKRAFGSPPRNSSRDTDWVDDTSAERSQCLLSADQGGQ